MDRALVPVSKASPTRPMSRILDERWSDYEAMTEGYIMRLLRVIRAESGPRESGRAQRMLAGASPVAYRGEYAFLGGSWPEMARFLAAHDLG